jgi:hypothetical protein
VTLELCSECDMPTGHAGRGEDSIYAIKDGAEIGPLCNECRADLWICNECGEVVAPSMVTFYEKHDGCGGDCE